MGKTAAQRQREYRDRAMRDPDGLLLTRLQVLVNAQAAAGLDRIVQATGWTKREAVEAAIKLLEKTVPV
ncbi:hypothetical protein [Acidithiobacillus sulfuriphilus]|uniref:Ribbon-helix-helix protein, CopG family n=2 Tax=Acidithiobacillus sulfuriphilus TaxID=1867749 RepID=A0A3M8RTI2_9PROT|nr:hypothetical protein [Acidithiobacillus sulfuriphilus]RNF71052.1 hypothetical protein EC580_01725 [Acidithiobacillus sulfuriphilus]